MKEKLVEQKKEKATDENLSKKQRLVMVSGGFDPLHLGHLLSFQAARALGDKLIVVIDGDEFLVKKKGAPFLPIEDRVAIIKELRCVDNVIVMGDGDLAEAIRYVRPDVIANGGDRNSAETIPESERKAADEVGAKMVFNVGGGKIRSSSDLLRNWIENK